ncbi:jabba [Musca autumnalis]|uniref:jabba n=1 Tax=Musca autumnalis TaxID=221902 RepID=UPI003CED436A
MAQETKTQKQQQKQQQQQKPPGDEITTTPGDEEEIEEIEIPQNKTLMDKIQIICEKFAATGMGQTILERCDRVLKVLEDTSKWSLPQNDNDPKLERPLPWIFFIPLIVWLRIIRLWLSFACIMVGGSPMTAERMVYNIQVKRRRLRAIRVPALRATRRLEADSGAMAVSGKNQTFIGKIRSLFGSAVCKPGQRHDAQSRRAFGTGNISKVTEEMSGERSVKRPRDDDNAELNMTFDQLLEKYVNEDSEEDSDYVPNEDEESSSESISSDGSISSAEVADISKPEFEIEKTAKDQSSSTLDHSVVEVKENGGPKYRPMPKPIADIKMEPISDADSGSDMAITPKADSVAKSKNTAAASEVANVDKAQQQQQQQKEQQKDVQTPKSQTGHQLNVQQDPEAKQKSTPGHESAASLKPALGAKTATGSPQDFHSIFHPAPLVKITTADAHHSTPKEADDRNDSSAPETPETQQKKFQNKPNHQHQQQQHHHHNNKNRNKNRR